VACSSSIERLMHNSFDAKGMVKVSIVLLTHKMQVTFPQHVFDEKTVTPAIICNTVLMIGFNCELLGMTEISPEQRKNLNQDGNRISDASLDSMRIRGEDRQDSVADAEDNVSLNKVKVEVGDNPAKAKSVTIKTAKIEISEATGLLSANDVNKITKAVSDLAGVVDCQINAGVLPNMVQVSFRMNGMPLRDII